MVRCVVVIGASAGGIAALQEVLAGLPADLPAAVLVAVHVQPSSDSVLPKVLSHAGPLPAHHPRDGEPLQDGTVLVAPPDRHLLVRPGRARLSGGPRENRQRPAIDPLFRSAAAAYGPAVVAVVLSGALDDGAVGAAAVVAQEGAVLVQDPTEARVSAMPRAALAAVRRARTARASELGPLITERVRRPGGDPPPAPDPGNERTAVMERRPAQADELGAPAALGCPECQGGMFERSADGTVSYACHVGHAWAAQTLLDAQQQAVEGAIYNAASKLQEFAAVHRRLADVADGETRDAHLRAAKAAEQRSVRVQELTYEDPAPE